MAVSHPCLVVLCASTRSAPPLPSPGTAGRLPGIAGTRLASFLSVLPQVMYTATVASIAIKVVLPQAALLHWAATGSFTLGLQLALRVAAVRQFLMGPGEAAAAAAGSGGLSGDTGMPEASVVARAATAESAHVLVVMGAQYSARQRYADAEYCLRRAVQLDPDHAR